MAIYAAQPSRRTSQFVVSYPSSVIGIRRRTTACQATATHRVVTSGSIFVSLYFQGRAGRNGGQSDFPTPKEDCSIIAPVSGEFSTESHDCEVVGSEHSLQVLHCAGKVRQARELANLRDALKIREIPHSGKTLKVKMGGGKCRVLCQLTDT